MKTLKSRLSVRRVNPQQTSGLNQFLRLYVRCFDADERVSAGIIRRVVRTPGRAVNPVHLFGAFEGKLLVGGAVTVAFPAFQVIFGSYLFVGARWRGQGLGTRILREVLNLERHSPGVPPPWRLYGEVTTSNNSWWKTSLRHAGFRFFPSPWPIPSYREPDKLLPARLCYYPFLSHPPSRFSQPAMLACVYTLFYGPQAMHRHLLPQLQSFIPLTPRP